MIKAANAAGETVEELQTYFQTQMEQVASLQPFAKREVVIWIVYTFLAMPVLFISMLVFSLFRTKSQNKEKTGPSQTPEVKQPKTRKPRSKGQGANSKPASGPSFFKNVTFCERVL